MSTVLLLSVELVCVSVELVRQIVPWVAFAAFAILTTLFLVLRNASSQALADNWTDQRRVNEAKARRDAVVKPVLRQCGPFLDDLRKRVEKDGTGRLREFRVDHGNLIGGRNADILLTVGGEVFAQFGQMASLLANVGLIEYLTPHGSHGFSARISEELYGYLTRGDFD